VRASEPELHQGGDWWFATATLEAEVQIIKPREKTGHILERRLDVFAVKQKGEQWKIGAIAPLEWKEKPPEDAVVRKDFKEVYPNLPATLELSFLSYAKQYVKLLTKDAPIVEEKMTVEEAIAIKYGDDPDIAQMLLEQVGDNTVTMVLGSGGSFSAAAAARDGMKEKGMSTRKADTFIRNCVKHELERSKRRLEFEESKVAALATLIELRETKLTSSATAILAPFIGSDDYKEAEVIASKRIKESYKTVKGRVSTLPKF